MWMKFYWISVVIFLFPFFLIAQNSELVLDTRVSAIATMIEVDNVGNVFLLNNGGVKKYNLQGNFQQKNSAMVYGEIASLDASNALKMVMYFRDLSQITYLDNQLASRGENVALDELGYVQTTQVCRSYNDGLWLYDQVSFELTRLNEQLEVTAQSGNLNQILNIMPEMSYMREVDRWLYVADVEGVFVFDWYGSYQKIIPIPDISKFVIRSNRLFYLKENKLKYYHLKTLEKAEILLKEKGVIDFALFGDRLLLITQNELVIYRINVN